MVSIIDDLPNIANYYINTVFCVFEGVKLAVLLAFSGNEWLHKLFFYPKLFVDFLSFTLVFILKVI